MLGGMQDLYITINTIKLRDECLDWLNQPNIEYRTTYLQLFCYVCQHLHEAAAESVHQSGGLQIHILWMDGYRKCLLGWYSRKLMLVLCMENLNLTNAAIKCGLFSTYCLPFAQGLETMCHQLLTLHMLVYVVRAS